MCAFKANIPQPTDRISVSQNDLLNNFAALNTIFGFNHETFDALTFNGKHNVLSMPRQASDPSVGPYPANKIEGNDIGVYARSNSSSGQTELYVKYASNGNIFPITGGRRAASGWTFLSGGTVMAWGSSSGSGDVVVVPPGPTYPTFTNTFSAQVTTWMQGTSPSDVLARLKSLELNGITVFCSDLSGSATNVGFQWMIIGQTVLT